MKTSLIIIVLALFSLVPFPGRAAELTGTFNVTTGVIVSDDDFSKSFDLDHRYQIGVMCDVKKETWPVSLAAGYFFSYGRSKISDNTYGFSTNRNADIFSSQTYLGLKKTLDWHPLVKPYFSGGLCSLDVYADVSYDHEYGGTVGSWYGAGLNFFVSKYWQVGLDWRRSRAKVKLFGHRLDAGGDHVGLSIGYRFPK